MIRYTFLDSPFGKALVGRNAEGICVLLVGGERGGLVEKMRRCYPKAELVEDARAVEEFAGELKRVLNGEAGAVRLPLAAEGTAFQKAVWRELSNIPRGSTITYGELARRAGNPKAVRAAAQACGANPVAIAIPCHRVIGADGSLTGFGCGLEVKRELLRREGALPNGAARAGKARGAKDEQPGARPAREAALELQLF